jgi:hypothetical protein
VCENNARAALNGHKIVTAAIPKRVPVLAWRLPLVDQHKYSPEVLKLIHEVAAGELTMYFLPGAPGMIMQNTINVRWGVANGTPCVMYSITLDPEDQARVDALVEGGLVQPGDILMLKHNPISINVLVESEFEGWPDFSVRVDEHTHTVRYQGVDIKPGDPGRPGRKWVLIPTPPYVTQKKSKLTTLDKLAKGATAVPGSGRGRRGRSEGVTILFYDPVMETAYSITFHKTQGGTLRKVILFLQLCIRLQHLYVGLTRVRRGADYAVMPGPLEHLLKLSHNADVKEWLSRLAPIEKGSSYLKWSEELSAKAVAAAAAAKLNPNTRKSRRLALPGPNSTAAVSSGDASRVRPAGSTQQRNLPSQRGGKGGVGLRGSGTVRAGRGRGRGQALPSSTVGALSRPTSSGVAGPSGQLSVLPVVGITNPVLQSGKTYCYLISLLQVRTQHACLILQCIRVVHLCVCATDAPLCPRTDLQRHPVCCSCHNSR